MLLEEIENKDDKQPEYKIFCDLDGVLVDFMKGVKKLLPDYDDAAYEKDPKYRKMMWDVIGDYTKKGGKYWAELDLLPDAMVLWDYISKYDTTEILTATGNSSHSKKSNGESKYGAEDQKREWVSTHLGDVKTIVVLHSEDKAQYAAPNHILIDDMQRSIGPWKEAGGIGISHTSAADTINELKKLGL